MTIGELYRMPRREGNRLRFRIPVAGALQTEECDLPLDPYTYGYWLGNGNAIKPELTIRTCDVAVVTGNIPYEISGRWDNVGDSKIVRVTQLNEVLLQSFRDKEIAPIYIRASIAQRMALQQGLMDSDGCVGKLKGQGVYVSTQERLAYSVSELLWSLSVKNNVTTSPSTRYGVQTGETLYTVRFTAFDDLQVSRLKRK